MKLFLTLVAATFLTLPRLQAVMYTYEGFVQSVQPGANWSLNGLQVGAAFQAHLELADDLVGQDLTAVYLASGVHPVRMEFIVAGESIFLSPYYVSYAVVNSGTDFGIWGEGVGPGAFWQMSALGGINGADWSAGAGQYGGPVFTAAASLVPPANVPDSGTTGPLLLIGAGSLFLCVRYRRAKLESHNTAQK